MQQNDNSYIQTLILRHYSIGKIRYNLPIGNYKMDMILDSIESWVVNILKFDIEFSLEEIDIRDFIKTLKNAFIRGWSDAERDDMNASKIEFDLIEKYKHKGNGT